MTGTIGIKQPAVEVADVIREYGEAFRAKHGVGLSSAQRQALRDLTACRTAALGGHVLRCLECRHERVAYNSCRNRHCPKCQALSRAQWLERQAEDLLPVEYHHVVFTLPGEVAELAGANPRLLYDALLQASSATLRDVAANPKRLGAQVGTLLVLHTWGQTLQHHPHVHAVVTGGGLSCDTHGVVDTEPRWLSCRPGFFLPVRVLSRVFRGKFLDRLRQAFEAGELAFSGRLALLADPVAFAAWRKTLYRNDWVVYAKPPFGGPAQVLKYLARYTHRVAISNGRLLKFEEGRVTFRYKDYADDHRPKNLTLDGVEFLRRFVQHVLPKGFVKIRHCGLLGNRYRQEKLVLCRRLLVVVAVRDLLLGSGDSDAALQPARVPCCPQCGGIRLVYQELPRAEPPAAASVAAHDSS
jgi:Putative transposase/Transposase zinc-binding domain